MNIYHQVDAIFFYKKCGIALGHRPIEIGSSDDCFICLSDEKYGLAELNVSLKMTPFGVSITNYGKKGSTLVDGFALDTAEEIIRMKKTVVVFGGEYGVIQMAVNPTQAIKANFEMLGKMSKFVSVPHDGTLQICPQDREAFRIANKMYAAYHEQYCIGPSGGDETDVYFGGGSISASNDDDSWLEDGNSKTIE